MRLIVGALFLAGCASSSPKPELELETPDVCDGVRMRDEAGEIADRPPSMSETIAVDGDDDDVWVYLAHDGAVRRFSIGDTYMGRVQSKVVPLNARYTAVSATVEHYGRTEDEDGPSATYVAGYLQHDAVIDTSAGRLVWVRSESLAAEDFGAPMEPCGDWGKVALSGETFSVGTCSGDAEFTLADISDCRND